MAVFDNLVYRIAQICAPVSSHMDLTNSAFNKLVWEGWSRNHVELIHNSKKIGRCSVRDGAVADSVDLGIGNAGCYGTCGG